MEGEEKDKTAAGKAADGKWGVPRLFGYLVMAIGVAVIIVSRFWAEAASLYEWDSVQFAMAIDNFDIARHSPHPPGYPVYVFLVRLLNLLVKDNTRSLTLASTLSSCLTPFALFYVLRDRVGREVAFAATLLYSFSPVVWFNAGLPLADSPTFCLTILAMAALTKGEYALPSYYLGAFLSGLALGGRPQHVLLLLPSLLYVSFFTLPRRGLKSFCIAVVAGLVGILLWLVPLIVDTGGINAFVRVNQAQARITLEWPHNRVGLDFTHLPLIAHAFVRLWGNGLSAAMVLLGSVIGLLFLARERPSARLVWLLGVFLPYTLFFLFTQNLDDLRYAIPSIPLFCVLSAVALMRVFPKKPLLGAAGIVLLSVWFSIWAYPAVRTVHTQLFPAVAAIRYAQSHMDPQRDLIVYSRRLARHAAYFLSGFTAVEEGKADERLLPLLEGISSCYLITDERVKEEGTVKTFRWDPPQVEVLARHDRVPYARIKRVGTIFGRGWYEVEYSPETGREQYWLGQESLAFLYDSGRGGMLRLHGAIPPRGDRREEQSVQVFIDEKRVDSFQASWATIFERGYLLPPTASRQGRWLSLKMIAAGSIVPAHERISKEDTRELALSVFGLTIEPPSAVYQEGWYLEEHDPQTGTRWRWMQKHARVLVPLEGSHGTLFVRGHIPLRMLPEGQTIEVRHAGKRVARFTVQKEEFTHTFPVSKEPNSQEMWVNLEILADHSFNPAVLGVSDDNRDLALMIQELKVLPDVHAVPRVAGSQSHTR